MSFGGKAFKKGLKPLHKFFLFVTVAYGDSEALRQKFPRLFSGKDQIVNIHALWNGVSIQIFLILSILHLFRNVRVILTSLKYRLYCTFSPETQWSRKVEGAQILESPCGGQGPSGEVSAGHCHTDGK